MFAHLRAVAKAYRRALRFADRYRRLQALLFLFMLVNLPVSTSIPLISKYIVDQAILGGNLVLFVNFAIICVAYYVINALVDVGYSLLHNNLKMRYARDFQFHLLRGVMAGSYSYCNRYPVSARQRVARRRGGGSWPVALCHASMWDSSLRRRTRVTCSAIGWAPGCGSRSRSDPIC